MKVIRIFDQHRRDCSIDIECEWCGNKQTYTSAYDDRNYWDNVVPSFKCSECWESTKTLWKDIEHTNTRYWDNEVV